jgi:hypothetical protein
LTKDVLTIPVLPGGHIKKLWEGATTTDISLPGIDAMLKTIREKMPFTFKMDFTYMC